MVKENGLGNDSVDFKEENTEDWSQSLKDYTNTMVGNSKNNPSGFNIILVIILLIQFWYLQVVHSLQYSKNVKFHLVSNLSGGLIPNLELNPNEKLLAIQVSFLKNSGSSLVIYSPTFQYLFTTKKRDWY